VDPEVVYRVMIYAGPLALIPLVVRFTLPAQSDID